MTAPTSDKSVRHILALSGGKAASCVRAVDMFGPILTMNCAELKAAKWYNAL